MQSLLFLQWESMGHAGVGAGVQCCLHTGGTEKVQNQEGHSTPFQEVCPKLTCPGSPFLKEHLSVKVEHAGRNAIQPRQASLLALVLPLLDQTCLAYSSLLTAPVTPINTET